MAFFAPALMRKGETDIIILSVYKNQKEGTFMHMSDVLLSPAVGAVMYGLSAGNTAYGIKKIQTEDDNRLIPLMAVSGAFVFSAQMINFTIPGTGSSGHIGGGILLAGMLGGAPALLTIAAVLIIQCLFFADGGLLALGANIFNMGVIPCMIIYPLIFKPLLKKKLTGNRIFAVSIISAVLSLQLGAFCVVLETLASGVTELPFREFLLLMQPIHLAIGAVEGVITGLVLNFVYRMDPSVIELPLGIGGNAGKTSVSKEGKKKTKRVIAVLAISALLVGGGLSLYASTNPDGLEWAILNVTGSDELERENEVYDAAGSIQESTAVMPDYDFSESESSDINGTSTAGILGAVLTFALAGGAAFIIRVIRRRNHSKGAMNG